MAWEWYKKATHVWKTTSKKIKKMIGKQKGSIKMGQSDCSWKGAEREEHRYQEITRNTMTTIHHRWCICTCKNEKLFNQTFVFEDVLRQSSPYAWTWTCEEDVCVVHSHLRSHIKIMSLECVCCHVYYCESEKCTMHPRKIRKTLIRINKVQGATATKHKRRALQKRGELNEYNR